MGGNCECVRDAARKRRRESTVFESDPLSYTTTSASGHGRFMSSQPTVSVIGAGMVGTCCALHLQNEGSEVTLLDRGGPWEASTNKHSKTMYYRTRTTIRTTKSKALNGAAWRFLRPS